MIEMESDLSVLCEGLKLTEEEQQEVEVSKEDVIVSVSKSQYCFMMYVVSDKEANRGALRSSMARVWQVERNVVFKEVGKNLFLVELKERADKRRIIQGRPWSFDKNLFCIQAVKVLSLGRKCRSSMNHFGCNVMTFLLLG